jgi:hypothetical protein
LMKTGFGYSAVVPRLRQKQLSFEAIQFRFIISLSSCVTLGQRFSHYPQPLLGLPCFPIRL